ncbi:hypothetical protein [Leifsonia sp. NPDC080035]|uniref:Uncharacterized protein n=1 Tax=Leifsonia sp. NPDC080035 TaxID=3143936 RepID=A0AAU7GI87_9MICO
MRWLFTGTQPDGRPIEAGPDVDELLRILDRAVDATAEADGLLDRHGAAEGGRMDARAALAARVELAAVEHELADVVCFPNDEAVRDRAAVIVTFYQHLLTHALQAQYSTVAPAHPAIRSAIPLPGDHTELAAIRDALRASAYGTR